MNIVFFVHLHFGSSLETTDYQKNVLKWCYNLL